MMIDTGTELDRSPPLLDRFWRGLDRERRVHGVCTRRCTAVGVKPAQTRAAARKRRRRSERIRRRGLLVRWTTALDLSKELTSSRRLLDHLAGLLDGAGRPCQCPVSAFSLAAGMVLRSGNCPPSLNTDRMGVLDGFLLSFLQTAAVNMDGLA